MIKRIGDNDYRCMCHNRSSSKGYYDSDDKGCPLEGSDLLCCYFCGRIFDKNTLEIVRGIHV